MPTPSQRLKQAHDNDNDSDNTGQDPMIPPADWPASRKWLVTSIASLTTFMVSWNALSIASAATDINLRFGISDANFPHSYWAVTAWEVGAAVMPIAGLPLLEDYGIRKGYLISYALFTLFVLPQALAQNFATLLVTRFFAGGFGSIVMNAVENVISDLWPGVSNSLPITVFMFMYLEGFTFGPILGSAILSHLNWRWIFYIEFITYTTWFPLLYLTIHETRPSTPSTTKTPSPDSPSKTPLSTTLLRPIQLFLTEPVVLAIALWSAWAVGLIFLATQSIAQVYSANYTFSDIQCGFIQTALFAGQLLGLLPCLAQNAYFLRHQTPEARLLFSIPASFLCFSGGLFLYAWTSYSTIPWIVPTLGLGLTGIGITVITQSAVTFLTDAYGVYAASALAAVAAMENMLSAFLPLAAQRMYRVLGFQWASSVVAFLALGLSFAPLALWFWGPAIRKRSRFMQEKGKEEDEVEVGE